MPLVFRPASRESSKLLIGLYGQSGSGKTYSALLLARGLAGPDGKIMMIDTEAGRGELYADVIPGGYIVGQLNQPFSPQAYIEAIDAAEKAGASVLVIDSVSHEWEGIGGVVHMAGQVEERTGKPGLHCWKDAKLQHQRLMLRLLQSKCHVIVCLRAKRKSRQGKDGSGKTVILKDDFATPIQADDFIFELTAHAEILQDHTIRLTKCSHPKMKPIFPVGQPISIETGKGLAAWCAQATAATPATSVPASSIFDIPHQIPVALSADGKPDWRAFYRQASAAIAAASSADFLAEWKEMHEPAIANLGRDQPEGAEKLRGLIAARQVALSAPAESEKAA